MKRVALVFAAVAALGWLAERFAASRATLPELRIERLIPEERAKELFVAAVAIERPADGQRWLLTRRSGLWRLRDATQAVGDSRAIEGLVSMLLEARVLRRSTDEAERAAYGLFPTPSWRVELCGANVLSDPDRDVLFGLDVGRSLEPRASLVQRRAESLALELDFDLSNELERAVAAGRAPFEDARLIAGPFPGEGRTIDRLFVDHADGTALELVRVRASEAEIVAGAAPWTWQLVVDGLAKPAPNPRVEAYLAFLTSIPIVRALPVKASSELGFERPDARVTALGSGGDAMVIEVVLRRDVDRAFGQNRTLATVAELDLAVAELVAARAESVLELDRPNVWDEWLRSHLPGARK